MQIPLKNAYLISTQPFKHFQVQ